MHTVSLEHLAPGRFRGPGIGEPRTDRQPRAGLQLPGDLIVVRTPGHRESPAGRFGLAAPVRFDGSFMPVFCQTPGAAEICSDPERSGLSPSPCRVGEENEAMETGSRCPTLT